MDQFNQRDFNQREFEPGSSPGRHYVPHPTWIDTDLTNEQREILGECHYILALSDWVVEQTIQFNPERTDVIRMVRDSADVANLVIRMLARNSEFSNRFVMLFGEISERAAWIAEQYEEDFLVDLALHFRRIVEISSTFHAPNPAPQTG